MTARALARTLLRRAPIMIRLALAAENTCLLSTLCASCPFAAAGCCVAPPDHDWSDVGRVVARGGRDFLLAEIRSGNLVPTGRGLAIRRVRRRESDRGPREKKCVYHGPAGCTISHDLRPATCNYYLCDEAYREGGEARGEPSAVEARRAHRALIAMYEGWDRELSAKIEERYPEGVTIDAGFLDWLGEAVSRLAG